MTEEILEICNAHAVVQVAPAAGGGIVRYAKLDGGTPLELLRPALPGAVAGRVPTDMSCFPLVPFSNRIRNGRFTYRQREVQLAPNFPPEPHAIHGDGWTAAWQVTEHSEERLTLNYTYDGAAWPFLYSARQSFVLSGDELSVALTVSNEGDEKMPLGFGIHPFFVRTPRTKLTAAVDGVWLSDDNSMPTELVPLPNDRRLDRGIDPNEVALDHNFTGWDGVAVVEWEDRGMRLVMRASGPFRFLVVYTPEGKDFLCVEPATNMLDAFNQAHERSDTGMIELDPGEEVSGEVTFVPEDLDRR